MFSIYNQWFSESLFEKVELPPLVHDIPAMLSQNERLAYYLAACDWYTFSGKILDCGVLVGGTTTAFVYGLLNNQRLFRNFDQLSELIHVYDNFIVGDRVYIDFFEKHYDKKYDSGDNFYGNFLYHIQPFQPFIKTHAGDIKQKFWQEEQFIELLGLDICKRDKITIHIAKEFFPYLQPDRSIVIQQDYSNGWLPHAIYIMEILADKFEKIFEANDLAAFKCVEQIKREEVSERLDYYRSDSIHLVQLMDQAIKKAMTLDTSWFLKLAKVKLFGENGDVAQGLAYLAEIEAQASSKIRRLPTYQSDFETECRMMRNWLLSQR